MHRRSPALPKPQPSGGFAAALWTVLMAALAAAVVLLGGMLLGIPAPAHATEPGGGRSGGHAGTRADAPGALDEVTWTVRTQSNRLGAARTSYSYTIRPGERLRDGLVITNRGDAPVELGVYAADGFTTESGGFDLRLAGTDSRALGSWVAPREHRVRIAAGDTVTVPFSIAVPENATPGDYAGGIVTSMSAAESDADAATQGVSVDRRLGIRMNLRVDGALKPGLAVEDVRVGWDGGADPFSGGDAEVSYTVRNTGNAILGNRDAVRVSGPFGWFPVDAAEAEAMPQLLPGESWTRHVRVRDVPALILLTATAGVTPTVMDATGSTAMLPTVEGAGTGWAVPWALAVLTAAAILLATLVPRGIRRRRAAQRAREDARVEAAVAEALERKDEAVPVP